MLFLYAAIKLVAYSLWCYFGIRYLKLNYVKPVPWAISFGVMRLLMGFVFGIAIWICATLVYSGFRTVLPISTGGYFFSTVATYLSVYVPIRWVEWSLMEVIMNRESRSFKYFIVGVNSASRNWRLGGIILSCLADVPMIITMGGLAIGRFMC